MAHPIKTVTPPVSHQLDADDYDRFLPPLTLTGGDLTGTCRDYLAAANDKIRYLMTHHIYPLDVHKVRSLQVDRLITGLFGHFKQLGQGPGACALMATGGYGREEMALMSDIDLLLITGNDDPDRYGALIEKILYILWDLKLEVGHAVRSLAENRHLMQRDHTILTALLDVRLIAGDQRFYRDLVRLRQNMLKNRSFLKSLLKTKIRERVARLKKYGGSVYLLEPHLKEGEGGLRDIQFIRWLAKMTGLGGGFEDLRRAGLLDDGACQHLVCAFNYYLDLRNRLHLLTGRKGDQLNFDAQRILARELGYKDTAASLGVEKFMREFYVTAGQVNTIVKTFIQKVTARQQGLLVNLVSRLRMRRLDENFKIVHGRIATVSPLVFEKHPRCLMTVFEHVQKTGLGLHFQTKDLIRKNLFRVDEAFRRDPEVCERFQLLVGRFKNLGKALFAMHEVRFFDAFIPEFGIIRSRMQHDVYHVYTVDTHSLFAVEELSKLCDDPDYERRFPSFKRAMLAVKRPDLLSLGLLFHDIGKGQGGNHSVIGARMAHDIMTRLGYPERDKKEVEFLVRSHLLMPHLSQRRDLEDLQMIREFARSLENLDRLRMLYVLTWADIRAVSSEAWTAWKGRLLESLYEKTRTLLEREETAEDDIARRVKTVRQEILNRMSDRVDARRLQKFLDSISPRYVVAHTDEEIFEHFHLLTGHDDQGLLFTEKERESLSEILVYTMHNPRVIPLVTGVLLALDINILTMENFMLTDGHILIKMRVQSRGKMSLRQAELVGALKRHLDDVFQGRRRVEDLIARRRQPEFMLKKPVQRAETRVHIDNDVSAYYTVIDVYAHDRLGLLYDIISCLVKHGTYVDVSKISTKVDQVVDTFYVKDIFGHKITAKTKIKEMRSALLEVIKPAN